MSSLQCKKPDQNWLSQVKVMVTSPHLVEFCPFQESILVKHAKITIYDIWFWNLYQKYYILTTIHFNISHFIWILIEEYIIFLPERHVWDKLDTLSCTECIYKHRMTQKMNILINDTLIISMNILHISVSEMS